MSYKLYLGATDISDYVVRADNVPQHSMNSDWTPRYEIFNLGIAETVSEISVVISMGGVIKVTDASDNFIWSGDITHSEFNYDNHVYDVRVESHLIKLRNTKFGYNEMHTLLATGLSTQYKVDYNGYNNVFCIWALTCAFSINGLTLNESGGGISSNILFNKTAKTGWAGKQITYGNLYFDEYQLYCLKLSTAVNPATAIAEYIERVANPVSAEVETIVIYKGNHEPELDCAEFVEETLTALRLGLHQTAVNTYELVPLTANHTVTSDNKSEYSSITDAPQSVDPGISALDDITGASDVWSSGATPRSRFYSATPVQINEYNIGGNDKISIMKNFTIYFADTDNFDIAYNESSCQMLLTGDWAKDTGTSSATLNIAAMRYKELAMTRTRETIVCPFVSTYATVVENYLDLENETSNIIQESYA